MLVFWSYRRSRRPHVGTATLTAELFDGRGYWVSERVRVMARSGWLQPVAHTSEGQDPRRLKVVTVVARKNRLYVDAGVSYDKH